MMEQLRLEEDEPFDVHHQLQGAMIDAYEATLADGACLALAADTLGHLVDFTATHCLEEERFMEAQGYPGLEPHRSAHAALLAHLRGLEAQARATDADAALAGVPQLRTWLLEHVDGPDRRLSDWREAQRRQPCSTT